MKKLKYIIMILGIIVIIMIGILLVMLKKQKQAPDDIEDQNIPQDTLVTLETNTIKEENSNIFFTVNDLVQSIINKEEKGSYYYAQEIYKIQNYEYATYYIYGVIQKENAKQLEDYYLKINIDYTRNTFQEEKLSVEEYKKAKSGEIKTVKTTPIQKNTNNAYQVKAFSSEEIARRYVKDYMLKVQYLPQVAFVLLEEEYQKQKFANIEVFKQYIQKNNNRFMNFVMKKYRCNVNEDSLEYIVTDQNDEYYKIIVYHALDYKIILDNYTIESDEYMEAYNKANEKDKVATCISKFFKLLNNKEYGQIYNKYLDNTFKKNNFATLEKFENYMQSNVFQHNTLTIQSEEKIGNVYVCKVNMKSGVGLSAEEKTMTITLQLKEGTDFVMSFNIA